jgi:hypothetical protein
MWKAYTLLFSPGYIFAQTPALKNLILAALD